MSVMYLSLVPCFTGQWSPIVREDSWRYSSAVARDDNDEGVL